MLEIDGSYGEGGGQIVRTALALSMLTQTSFHVTNIRQGRKKPGLKHQHLHCISALKQLSDSVAENATLGSEELTFYPRPYKAKNIIVDVQTAGSLTLLLQSLILPSIFAKKAHTIKLIGGTDTSWSMPVDYLNHVFIPHLRKFAKKVEVKTVCRGYYPKGQGIIEFSITPNQTFPVEKQIPIELKEQGILQQIKGVSHASNSLEDKKVAERQAQAAEMSLRKLNIPVNIDIQYDNTFCPGSGITLWASFVNKQGEIDQKNPVILGADSLGSPGKPAEQVGTEAADRLIKEIDLKAPVDSHIEDNLIPFLAIFGGSMRVATLTNHTKTNIFTCNQFLEKKIVVEDSIIKQL